MSHDTHARKAFGVSLETLTRRILAVFDRATAGDLEAGARWYDEAGDIAATLAAEYNITREHAAAVLAALSPRTPWSRNLLAANDVLGGHAATYALQANVNRAYACLQAEDPVAALNGPKTNRFARNILGDREAVTVDVWAARVAGVDETKLGRKGAYDALEHAYRLAARRRGVDPATMQATTWVVARNGRAA